MTDSAELFVTFRGKDVGLKAMIASIEAELKKADSQAQKSEKETETLANVQAKAANSALALAQSYARLDVAEGNAVQAASRLRTALDANGQAGERQTVAAQTQLANLDRQVAGTDRFSTALGGLKNQALSAAAGMISLGAGIQVATQVAQSFADAFTFKAGLDATTNSINIQLKGVRDSGVVWNESAAFAEKYKLTQEQTTEAIQASVGVLRTSKAPLTDVLGVLGRLQVLSPEQSMSEAALAVKALASGDITSLVGRFEVSRDAANKMKAEILGGADAVTVLSKFLDQSGVSMDALAAGTTGAAGKLKELAQAQEQLKLAQAEFAQGPGMAILGGQIDVIRGGTRLLSGDFANMGTSLVQAFADGNPVALALAQSLGVSGAQAQAAARQYLAHNAAIAAGTSGGQQWGAVVTTNAAAIGAQAQATGTATTAVSAQNTAIGALLTQTTTTTSATAGLAVAQTEIAQLGGAVANGLITAANAADVLARQYGITTVQADGLISAQARLAGQKAQTRDNSGSIGFNAPGRSGGSDADIFATVAATTKANLTEQTAKTAALTGLEIARAKAAGDTGRELAIQRAELAKLTVGSSDYINKQREIVNLEASGAKGGGGGRSGAATGAAAVKAEQAFQTKSADQEQAHQQKLVSIAADGAKKRAAAESSLQQASLDSRASFYGRLGDIEDNGTRQALSAKFEDASRKAQDIAAKVGPDAAQAYMDAATRTIEGQQSIQDKIDAANKAGNSGQAAYQTGVLALQQAADSRRLQQIQDAGSAISSEQAAQYTAEEQAYGVHLDKMLSTYQAKTGGAIIGIAPPGVNGASGTPAPLAAAAPSAPTSGTAQPVIDLATPAAVDQQTGQLLGSLGAIKDSVNEVASRISAVERAVSGLQRNGAFAP